MVSPSRGGKRSRYSCHLFALDSPWTRTAKLWSVLCTRATARRARTTSDPAMRSELSDARSELSRPPRRLSGPRIDRSRTLARRLIDLNEGRELLGGDGIRIELPNLLPVRSSHADAQLV